MRYLPVMEITPEQIRAARALYEDLRAISLKSAARLQDRERLTVADLYDENGVPA